MTYATTYRKHRRKKQKEEEARRKRKERAAEMGMDDVKEEEKDEETEKDDRNRRGGGGGGGDIEDDYMMVEFEMEKDEHQKNLERLFRTCVDNYNECIEHIVEKFTENSFVEARDQCETLDEKMAERLMNLANKFVTEYLKKPKDFASEVSQQYNEEYAAKPGKNMPINESIMAGFGTVPIGKKQDRGFLETVVPTPKAPRPCWFGGAELTDDDIILVIVDAVMCGWWCVCCDVFVCLLWCVCSGVCCVGGFVLALCEFTLCVWIERQMGGGGVCMQLQLLCENEI